MAGWIAWPLGGQTSPSRVVATFLLSNQKLLRSLRLVFLGASTTCFYHVGGYWEKTLPTIVTVCLVTFFEVVSLVESADRSRAHRWAAWAEAAVTFGILVATGTSFHGLAPYLGAHLLLAYVSAMGIADYFAGFIVLWVLVILLTALIINQVRIAHSEHRYVYHTAEPRVFFTVAGDPVSVVPPRPGRKPNCPASRRPSLEPMCQDLQHHHSDRSSDGLALPRQHIEMGDL